jgi:hypothetical protein
MLAQLYTVRRKLVPAGTDTDEVQSRVQRRTLPQWVLQQHGARCWRKRLTLPASLSVEQGGMTLKLHPSGSAAVRLPHKVPRFVSDGLCGLLPSN